MPDDPLHNLHDKLFKAGFSDPATAGAFRQDQLPPAISARIQWEHLELQPGPFVSPKMRERHSDLLFTAPFIPDFRFQLMQLAEMPFESIRGTPSGIHGAAHDEGGANAKNCWMTWYGMRRCW